MTKVYVVYRNPKNPEVIDEIRIKEFDFSDYDQQWEDYRLCYDYLMQSYWRVEQIPDMLSIIPKVVVKQY